MLTETPNSVSVELSSAYVVSKAGQRITDIHKQTTSVLLKKCPYFVIYVLYYTVLRYILLYLFYPASPVDCCIHSTFYDV